MKSSPVSVWARGKPPAPRAPAGRDTGFAGIGGLMPEAANWNKSSSAFESSCLSRWNVSLRFQSLLFSAVLERVTLRWYENMVRFYFYRAKHNFSGMISKLENISVKYDAPIKTKMVLFFISNSTRIDASYLDVNYRSWKPPICSIITNLFQALMAVIIKNKNGNKD